MFLESPLRTCIIQDGAKTGFKNGFNADELLPNVPGAGEREGEIADINV